MKKSILFTRHSHAFLLTACGADQPPPPPRWSQSRKTNSIVVAEGTLLPDPSVELSFAQPGILAEMLVSEGEQVNEGQIIARLENSEALQAEVARAEEAYLMAEQAFNTSEAAALQESVRCARSPSQGGTCIR